MFVKMRISAVLREQQPHQIKYVTFSFFPLALPTLKMLTLKILQTSLVDMCLRVHTAGKWRCVIRPQLPAVSSHCCSKLVGLF